MVGGADPDVWKGRGSITAKAMLSMHVCRVLQCAKHTLNSEDELSRESGVCSPRKILKNGCFKIEFGTI